MEKNNSNEEIDIQKYLLVFKRRWRIIAGILIAFSALGTVMVKLQPTTYVATGKLLFQMNRSSSLTGVGEKIGHLESIGPNPLETQALLIKSQPIIQQVINNLNLKDEKGESLQPEDVKIEVEPIVGTDGLNVSYTSKDPNLAKQIVNQVMKSYIDNNILANKGEAIAAGNFIDKQLPTAKIYLEQAQNELLRFKRQNKVVDLQEETTGLVKNVLALDGQINDVSSQLAEATTKEQQISGQIKQPINKALDISSLSQAAGVQEVISELQKIQTQLKIQQTRYTDANPIISSLKNQEAALQSLLQERIKEHLGYSIPIEPTKLQLGERKRDLPVELEDVQTQRLTLAQKIQFLTNLKNSYNQRLSIIPNLEKIQSELEQKVSLAQKNYENLWLKSREIKIVQNQAIGNARILEYAQVENSLSAFKTQGLIVVVAIFGGLLIGVAVAFVVDIIDRRVKTVKEAEGLFNYTLLGLIPNFANSRNSQLDIRAEGVFPDVIVETYPRSIIHEAFGMLQANLKFSSLDKKVRTIAVTSSLAGEGKSEVAANLAALMAQTGLRVLLVDADLRRPSQHHIWNLINSIGLSNVVVDEVRLQQAVQRVAPNLSVLTSGVIPPNPLAIIDSKAMRTLIAHLSREYDYIIIDTPPLLGNAEGLVLSNIADGVLVLARIGVVDSTSITTAKTLLSRSEANVLGLVANDVEIQQEPSYFYYQSQPLEAELQK
ncbi:polysaccharide biosynthesis tyrosine autokinase [Nostoc sp. FACHB-152]|uniref:GumC family protein n=1 Tax=unclassified Nostoc TaxID=2593658 RepID=UPI001681EB84|nr:MULTISPECIES: polysaccharide biosynthesis tyrosine autokinase [unclassified Nostoc]MBD2451213.1 polysaccharide biosynthesis tyrosine autokinase [Nostoc sp. FACHB-152]MBD2472225.1 polysaccharide biosynthesis tyrosine autokinase [Nostoc sp. FACHB-145]